MKITEEQRNEAIKLLTEYRIQNEGFYAKLTIRHSGNDKENTVDWYEDLEQLVMDVWHIGCENISVIAECKQVTKEEYDANHLPF